MSQLTKLPPISDQAMPEKLPAIAARFSLLLSLLAFTFVLNVCLGEINLTPQNALQAVFNPTSDVDAGIVDMLWQIRLPRLLSAFAVGAGLAVSGYLLQSLSRNFLADPYLTGVSSGAGLSIAVAMVLGLDFSFLPLAALAGGLASSLLVALMSRTSAGISVTRLLLSGVAVSAVCGSLITLMITVFPDGPGIQGLFFWLAGSLSGRGWLELQPAAIYITAALGCAFALSKPLRLLSLGQESAASLGLNVPLMQWLILAIAVILCGACVALSGIVGFVGLIAPYFARRLFGSDQRWHLLSSICIGGILVLIADLAARTVAPGQELPLGTLLSLIGAPFFLWLIIKQKGESM